MHSIVSRSTISEENAKVPTVSSRGQQHSLTPVANENAASSSNNAPSTSSGDKAEHLDRLSNVLWNSAYESLRKDQPEMMNAYEKLAKHAARQEQDGSPSAEAVQRHEDEPNNEQQLTQGDVQLVAQRERRNMENKQWSYPWFGHSAKVRDTTETILKGVKSASALISSGMTMAPMYVSLPWSMISTLIPFVLQSLQAVEDAIIGLSEVTSILLTYVHAEQEFLPHHATKEDFSRAVLALYTSVFRYQATVALYFARGTLSRLGYNMRPKNDSWKDALAAVKNEESKCRVPIQALSTRLNQMGIVEVKDLLQRGFQLMTKSMQQSSSERQLRERIAAWISRIDVRDDHLDVRQRLGDSYFGSGRWLLDDDELFDEWKRSNRGVLLLQGVVGSGKSTLTSIVIEDLLRNSRGQVAFFYCSGNTKSESKRDARNESLNIMRSLLAQCAILSDGSVAAPIEDLYHAKQSVGGCDLSLRATVLQLRDVLNLNTDKQVTFVIDALDECTDQDDLFTSLAKILSSKANVRLFMSSRFGTSPNSFDLSTFFPPYTALPIGSQNSVDINSYVEREVRERSAGSGMKLEQADRLISALKKYSEGVFRWVVLEVDIFLPRSSRQGRRQQVRDIERRLVAVETSNAPAVDRLFDSYEQIYEYALGMDDEIDRRALVKTAIKWVLCAFQTLTIRNVAEAMALKIRLDRLEAFALRVLEGEDEHEGVMRKLEDLGSDVPLKPIAGRTIGSDTMVAVTEAIFEYEDFQ